jgi:hypothetical protein
MSTENIDEEDYKKIIGDLMEENETLKRRIVELEEMNRILLNSPQETIIETPKTRIEYDLKTPDLEKEVITSSSILSQDTLPLEMGKGPIVEGISRRKCPICGNTSKALIHEIIDRTHIISAYPRMYGKKYKCGQCGREWRIPVEY